MLTETIPVDHLSTDLAATPRARQLAQIVEMLATAPAVRGELVADIHRQMADGGYLNEQKLDLAIERMLKDILR